jgi:hypothetical protein
VWTWSGGAPGCMVFLSPSRKLPGQCLKLGCDNLVPGACHVMNMQSPVAAAASMSVTAARGSHTSAWQHSVSATPTVSAYLSMRYMACSVTLCRLKQCEVQLCFNAPRQPDGQYFMRGAAGLARLSV